MTDPPAVHPFPPYDASWQRTGAPPPPYRARYGRERRCGEVLTTQLRCPYNHRIKQHAVIYSGAATITCTDRRSNAPLCGREVYVVPLARDAEGRRRVWFADTDTSEMRWVERQHWTLDETRSYFAGESLPHLPPRSGIITPSEDNA